MEIDDVLCQSCVPKSYYPKGDIKDDTRIIDESTKDGSVLNVPKPCASVSVLALSQVSAEFRTVYGPSKEIFFSQHYHPGQSLNRLYTEC